MGLFDFLGGIFGGGAQEGYRGAGNISQLDYNKLINAQQGNIINPAMGMSVSGINQQQQLVNALQGQGAMGMGNQAFLSNQLRNQALGKGPSVAQAQLDQATARNVGMEASQMASARGAGANVAATNAAIARQGGDIQQQAAGQAATLRAQEQLAAQQQLGQLAGTQVGQQQQGMGQLIGAQQGYQNLAQQQYGTMTRGLESQNAINAGMAQFSGQQSSNVGGGILGAIGGIFGLAEGGEVPGDDDDEPGGPKSFIGKFVKGYQSGSSAMNQKGGNAVQSGFSKLGQGLKGPLSGMMGGGGGGGGMLGGLMGGAGEAEAGAGAAGGLSGLIGELGPLAMLAASKGGHVPGKAKHKGDSLKNDTVPAMLSPGEIVIPKSVIESPDPVDKSAKFVQAILARKR